MTKFSSPAPHAAPMPKKFSAPKAKKPAPIAPVSAPAPVPPVKAAPPTGIDALTVQPAAGMPPGAMKAKKMKKF